MTRAEALSQVYREEWRRMVEIVARALPRGEAEDVVAQAFADVWAVSKLADVEALRRYAWKAVWNGCADIHRRGRHTTEVELNLWTQTLGAREFDHADARLDVWLALPALTDKQQAVLWARCEGDTTYPEIARRLGISTNGARTAAFRGWQSARRKLTGRAR